MAHVPVLLSEVLALTKPKEGEFFIDGTVDGGGYSRAILERIGMGGMLLAIDWDETMVKNFDASVGSYRTNGTRVITAVSNFAELSNVIATNSLPKADGIVLDLGFSSEQLSASGRGFSFAKDEPLLMTYNDEMTPAYELIRRMSERELGEVIRLFGEERYAGKIARAIKERLKRGTIRTTGELVEVITGVLPKNYERGRIHPATRTFQALRIAANHELENLETVLRHLPDILQAGGRAAVVSFHSLEDRIVKHRFASFVKDGRAVALTKKPITASEKELSENPRSRSAKLRALSFI